MANRYCNLVGSKKISEDFQNINIGFDAVQQDMDSKSSGDHRHPNATDTTDGFMSAQDKAKMDASTASATPGTLVQRDASGRMKAAAPSAKTDVARKAEVDAVQADLDEHKADAVMHVTEADHEKLGSIEEGAEVNQPAFSRVNDIEAGEKTDALTFKGGVGIKITTNPATNEVTFTASGDSTPGDHGSSHTEYGADPIPNATAKEGGLMSAADKAEHDKIAPEVPKHSEQLKEHTAELEDHEQRIDDMEAGLADAPDKPLELRPGLQIVESEQDAPFQMGEIKGRTLINLFGSEGNFDYRTSPLFTFFGTGEIIPASTPVGTKVQKIVCNRAADSPGHFGARYELNIDRSKHYVAVAYLDNISCDEPVYFSFAEWKSTGYSTIRKSGNVKKGDGMQYRYIDISPDRLETQEKLVFYFRGEGTAGAEFRIGAFGLYEITQAEYDAIAKMTPEQVAARYPYVDSMTNVKNPYAIVTGGNLLPPFYEWDTRPGDVIVGPYHLQKTATAQYQGTISPKIRVIRGQTYTLSSTRNGRMVLGEYKEDGTVIGYPIAEEKDNNGYFSQSVTIGADTDYVIVQLSNMAASGTFSFEDTMLVPDSEPKPFTPQQRSIIAFETELAAHPVDGSNPDTLFMGDDGLPYVNEMWGKVVLDGSLSYRLGTKTTAWKQVYFDISQGVIDSEIVIKFNGTRLTSNQYMDGSDQSAIDSVDKTRVYLTIANTDSGWGPDYKPELDEIKAYFLGWRMCQQETAGLYNGTGTRCWGRVTDPRNVIGAGGWDATTVLPTTPAGTDALGNVYTPYRLQYLKAKPTVEPVRNYELGATLSAGSNMVEVGSGIVIREKANPFVNYINAINAAGGRLKYRTTRLLAIYRNQARDFGWTFKDNIWNGEPYQYAEHPIPALANAVYHVTYTMLDPTLAAPINGTVAANLRGTVSDLVQDVGDIGRRLSVVETQKAEKDTQPPEWIKATLLNGWTNTDGKDRPVSYRKVGDAVEIDGTMLASGVTTTTVAFRLPDDYKPSKNSNHLVSKSSTGGTNPYARVFVDAATGEFRIVPEGGAINDWVSLNGIRLYV